MSPRALIAFALLSLPRSAVGEPAVLVELFTSEGCSSCPPADALLARLAEERPGGVRVVALSEHVDYWDGLGWRDRFSSPLFTQRQEAYARRLGLRGLYTPQLVVGGRSDVLGSDGKAARSAIAAAGREPSGRIEARIEAAAGADLEVVLSATWTGGLPADVLVAVVQDRATSQVTRGENAGRTLEHASVVRSLSTVGSGSGSFSGRLSLRRADLPPTGSLVAFVQGRDGGAVHALATVRLP